MDDDDDDDDVFLMARQFEQSDEINNLVASAVTGHWGQCILVRSRPFLSVGSMPPRHWFPVNASSSVSLVYNVVCNSVSKT